MAKQTTINLDENTAKNYILPISTFVDAAFWYNYPASNSCF
ncbi:hypothetical protein TRIP_D420002 [uncultured Paludibacter sp.]|nr:hypothetical protein TRIP_D420002 [uncultured Paludibacter sp.]